MGLTLTLTLTFVSIPLNPALNLLSLLPSPPQTLFSPLRRTFFKHSVTSTVEVAVDRVMSRSYLQVLGKEEQQKIREKLKEMFDKVQENGEVTLPLVCEVAVFEKQTVEKSKQ